MKIFFILYAFLSVAPSRAIEPGDAPTDCRLATKYMTHPANEKRFSRGDLRQNVGSAEACLKLCQAEALERVLRPNPKEDLNVNCQYGGKSLLNRTYLIKQMGINPTAPKEAFLSTVQPGPDLVIEREATPKEISVGQKVEYKITVSNKSVEPAPEASLLELLDTLRYGEARSSQGAVQYDAKNNQVRIAFGLIPSGGSATVAISGTATAVGRLATVTEVNCRGCDADSSDNELTYAHSTVISGEAVNDPAFEAFLKRRAELDKKKK